MSTNTIEQAQVIVGSGMRFDRLDQVYDLQRLIGPVIAYKTLLDIVVNSDDPKEQRMAASRLLDAAKEDPERIADRLRASIFHDLTIEQLNAIVRTGITDPSEAVRALEDAGE